MLPLLRRAIDSGVVAPVTGDPPLTYPETRPDDVGAVLGRTETGACIFFDRVAKETGCCRVQRHAGVAAMPLACRQFPRIVRHDAAGTDVSLSHWCPTALAALDARRGPVTIVTASHAFAGAHAMEGLDARTAWPPLLRPDCLADREAYEAIEAATVDVLANGVGAPQTRLRDVAALYEHLRTWRPAHGPQTPFVIDAIDAWQTRHARTSSRARAADQPHVAIPDAVRTTLWEAVCEAIPHEERWRMPVACGAPVPSDARDVLDTAAARARIGRYLAARCFGAWVAYQGTGLRTMLAYLAAAFVAIERSLPAARHDLRSGDDVQDHRDAARLSTAIRTADLLLLHLGSPNGLVRRLSAWEDAPLPFSASG